MPSINQCKEIITQLFQYNTNNIPYLVGKPGVGKSAIALQAGEYMGLSPERILVVHVNDHDVVDFTGVPSIKDGMTVFNPTEMFYKFRKGTGAGLIIFEEVAQSSVHHQTWIAGFAHERKTPTFELDDDVCILMTGNRAEDKSGAKPILRHLQNRAVTLEGEVSLDDWTDWALENGVPTEGIAFIRLRPDVLMDFDASRAINATPRAWAKVFLEVPMDMQRELYLYTCEGIVGEGVGADWVAAKDLMSKMPSPDYIRAQPEKAEVHEEPAVNFAVATALATSTDSDNFKRTMTYVERMKKTFQMVYVNDAVKKHPELQQTRDFIKWAVDNKDIFMGE